MTEQLTTTSILSLFETTKEQRQSFVLDLLSRLESVNPLQVHLQVKCMEDVCKLITSNDIYRKAVVEESEKQGQKSFQFHNAKFEIKEVGTKYDYSKCEDPEIERLSRELEAAKLALKQREDFLKTIPQKGVTLTDTETGDTYTVYPPAKSSTTNVAVTLK